MFFLVVFQVLEVCWLPFLGGWLKSLVLANFCFSTLQGEVNCVKWDPTGSLLASCSDDITAKVICIAQFCGSFAPNFLVEFTVFTFIFEMKNKARKGCVIHATCSLHSACILLSWNFFSQLCSPESLMQIWSMKQDKYVYDLKEHSKVLLVIQYHVLEFCNFYVFRLEYNVRIFCSGDIHHKMEPHWTGYQQSKPAVSVGQVISCVWCSLV